MSQLPEHDDEYLREDGSDVPTFPVPSTVDEGRIGEPPVDPDRNLEDEVDPAYGVAADAKGIDLAPSDDSSADLQERESGAPVEYTEESEEVDELVEVTMAETTESPEAWAATDHGY